MNWWPAPGWRIGGLPLPADLVALVESGRWSATPDRARVDRLFPVNYGLCLYPIRMMKSETRSLRRQYRSEVMWFGQPDADAPPGDLDPSLAVLIADLGFGSEQPFALDYRDTPERPRVLTLRWSDYADGNRWVYVAADVAAFATMIGL